MAFLFCPSFNWITSSSNFLRKDTWGCEEADCPFMSENASLVFAMLCGLQNLNSLTRDWTWAPSVKALSPNHWTTSEFPENIFNLLSNIIKLKKIIRSTRKELVWSSGEHLGWLRISVSQLYLWLYAWFPQPVKRGGWVRSQVASFDLTRKDILCRPAQCPGIPLLGIYPWNENACPHKDPYMNICSCFIQGSPKLETSQMSISWWMDK